MSFRIGFQSKTLGCVAVDVQDVLQSIRGVAEQGDISPAY